MEFLRQFVHGQVYLLPDGTPVRALLYNLECLQAEWVFEDLSGVRQLGVQPDGRVVAYVPAGRDYFGLVYDLRPSDLVADDLREAEGA
jgi:hypothetical protein